MTLNNTFYKSFCTIIVVRKSKMAKGKITVHNKISSNFRQLHVDGAWGGVTPRGQINLNFYAERTPIPKSTDFEITDGGTVGNVLGHSEDSKQGFLREFEVGIYMDLNAAKSLAQFLNGKVAELEKLITTSNESPSKKNK